MKWLSENLLKKVGKTKFLTNSDPSAPASTAPEGRDSFFLQVLNSHKGEREKKIRGKIRRFNSVVLRFHSFLQMSVSSVSEGLLRLLRHHNPVIGSAGHVTVLDASAVEAVKAVYDIHVKHSAPDKVGEMVVIIGLHSLFLCLLSGAKLVNECANPKP